MIKDIEEIEVQRRQQKQQNEIELQNIHNEYCDKEKKLVQIILQKTGLEIDMEMPGNEDGHYDQINLLELIDVLIKQIKAHNDNQYEGGLTSKHELDVMQKSKNEGLQKAVASKLAARQEKRDNFDQTKAALSRRNAEIEKKLVESDT